MDSDERKLNAEEAKALNEWTWDELRDDKEAIRSDAWIEALAERWERRLAARNNIAWNQRDAGRGEQLADCLKELREEMKNAQIEKLPG